MKYCSKRCLKWISPDDEMFCSECGTELTPCIKCLCGKELIPKELRLDGTGGFCVMCGRPLTPEYLSQCMKAQVKELVKGIATKQSAPVPGGNGR